MRILHVNKYLYRRGGAEAYLLDVSNMQQNAGHEVEFFGMQHPSNQNFRYAADFPEQIDLDPQPTKLDHRLKAVGRMFYSPASRHGLAKVLADFKPDVVHMHNIYHQLSPSVLRATQDVGVPTVMTLHDYKLACPSYLMLAGSQVCDACLDGRFYHAVTKRCKDDSFVASALLATESMIHRRSRAYEPVRTFLCPSLFLANVMTKAGVYPDRLTVLSNFMDSETIIPKATPGGGAVYVGRLFPEKGVETLIRAAGLVPGLRVDIAGEGPELSRLQTLVDQVAPGQVAFHGRLPRPQVLELIRASGVLVLPSHCNENQPLAVLEAFSCSVPVIASALGGLPELVPETCGALVPPQDPHALARALAETLCDPDAAFRMGKCARSRVIAAHSPEDHLEKLTRAYQHAIDSPVDYVNARN